MKKSKKNVSKIKNMSKSIYSTGKKEKSKKKKKTESNPPKISKRKTEININQEKTNNSNNSKSISKIRIKENINFISGRDKKTHYSSKILKKNSIKNGTKNLKSQSKNKTTINDSNYNDFEMNTLEYEKAMNIDKRSYFNYYISLIKTKHPIIFIFLSNDFNVTIIKICILLLSFAINYAFNTFFFDFTIIHNVYKDQGEYNISYLFPLSFYSFIITYYINIAIKYLVLSERNILEYKNQKKTKVNNLKNCFIIKNVSYFVTSVAFLIFFWYYLASFCAVYQNSQIHVIKNTFISFALSLLYPFIINLIPGILRIFALKGGGGENIYKASKIIQVLL